MASPLVQRFRNDVAPRLMAKFANGGTKTEVRTVTPNPDPLQPSTVVTTSSPFNAYVKGVSAQMVTADPNLQASDLLVLVAAIDFIPQVSKMVEINGKTCAIIRVDAIPAAGDPAIYKFYVR